MSIPRVEINGEHQMQLPSGFAQLSNEVVTDLPHTRDLLQNNVDKVRGRGYGDVLGGESLDVGGGGDADVPLQQWLLRALRRLLRGHGGSKQSLATAQGPCCLPPTAPLGRPRPR